MVLHCMAKRIHQRRTVTEGAVFEDEELRRLRAQNFGCSTRLFLAFSSMFSTGCAHGFVAAGDDNALDLHTLLGKQGQGAAAS